MAPALIEIPMLGNGMQMCHSSPMNLSFTMCIITVYLLRILVNALSVPLIYQPVLSVYPSVRLPVNSDFPYHRETYMSCTSGIIHHPRTAQVVQPDAERTPKRPSGQRD